MHSVYGNGPHAGRVTLLQGGVNTLQIDIVFVKLCLFFVSFQVDQ